MVKLSTALFTSLAAAAPTTPTPNSNGTIAMLNYCGEPIYHWSRLTYNPEDFPEGAQASGGTPVAKGLTVLNPEHVFGYAAGLHTSTSKNSYADHNTKGLVFALESSETAFTIHVNLLDVFGKPKWLGAVAAYAAVECSDTGLQQWTHSSVKHYEGKGTVECRGAGNKITKMYAGIAYALCANPKDLSFTKEGELMYQSKAAGYKAAAV